jgi:mercuric ion binding protein
MASLALPAPRTAIGSSRKRTSCAITVRKALDKTPGVASTKIDFDKKTATVRFDPERANIAALVKATSDAGYPSSAHH